MKNQDTNIRHIYRYSVMVNQYFQEVVTDKLNEVAQKNNVHGKMKFSYFFVMCELYHKRKPLSLTQISQLIHVKLPNVSNIANELLDLGLIRQVLSEENHRKVEITLTDLGWKFSDEFVEEYEKIERKIYGDDHEKMIEAYDRIYQRLLMK